MGPPETLPTSAGPPAWLDRIHVEPRRYGLGTTLAWAAAIYALCLYASMLATPLEELLWVGHLVNGIDFTDPPPSGHIRSILKGPPHTVGLGLFCLLGLMLVTAVVGNRRCTLRAYFETRPISWRRAIRYVLLAFLLYVTAGVSALLLGKATGTPSGAKFWMLPGLACGSVLVTVLLAPWFEEVFWRGFIFTGIAHSRLGFRWAILLTALVWAGGHLLSSSWHCVPGIFVFGLFLGWLRHTEKSIALPILLHGLWNLPWAVSRHIL